jgi:hypothetical protein
MKQVVATVGIHGIVHSRPYRPMGKGKIEALNQTIRNAFQAEVKASSIRTLDALNEAFVAWADLAYNNKVHSETGDKPRDRWRAGMDGVEYLDEGLLRQAFLWRETRKADKTGVFSLFGTKYQVDTTLAKKSVEVRYDPEMLEEVEVWCGGEFRQRTRPFEVQAHRRPTKPVSPEPVDDGVNPKPKADWLGHLVEERRNQLPALPKPPGRRAEADRRVIEVLRDKLDPDVFDRATVTDFLKRYGPFDSVAVEDTVVRVIERSGRNDQHVSFYLDAIKAAVRGAQ